MESKPKDVRRMDYVVVPLGSGPDWHGRMGRRPQPKLKSEDAHYWYEHGRRLEAAGRAHQADATRAYAKALDVKPNHGGARLRLEQLRRAGCS